MRKVNPDTIPNQYFITQSPAGVQYVYTHDQQSSMPVVMGVITLIWGIGSILFSVIGLLAMTLIADPNSELYVPYFSENSAVIMLTTIVTTAISLGYVIGGVMMILRKKRGVYVTWGTIVVITVINSGFEILYPTSQWDPNALGTPFALILNILCAGICGFLVAIPLMANQQNMWNDDI